MSIASGNIVAFTGRWRPMMWFGWALFTLGYGLMIMLSESSNKYAAYTTHSPNDSLMWLLSGVKEAIPMIGALGLGCLFQVSTRKDLIRTGLMLSCLLDTPDWSTGGHASQGHGYIHGNLWFHQVRAPIYVLLTAQVLTLDIQAARRDHRYYDWRRDPFQRAYGGRRALGCTHAFWRMGQVLQKKVKGISGLNVNTSAANLNQLVPQIKNIPVGASFLVDNSQAERGGAGCLGSYCTHEGVLRGH